ncbi:MAG: 30S ribosomal protein S6 [Ignavibacteriae bacterium HGW-Ignavibacteriae-1]|jgi:small subunit ribosomal protein S6|nr:MAG: 30S ribosomal protein S6 [Ignavibacteriae bacterium HGW-Ignavibacteriae-1]
MNLRRIYESTIILNAALEDADLDTVVGKISGYIENHGGEVLEVNKWGRKRLAYPINKKYNGLYIHVVFSSIPTNVPIFERFLVLEDTVLRHLTLLLPEKLREFRRQRALVSGKAIVLESPEEPIKEETATTPNERGRGRYNKQADAPAAPAAPAVEKVTEQE